MLKKASATIAALCLFGTVQAEEVKNHSIGLTSAITSVNSRGVGVEDSSGLGLSYFTTFSDDDHRQWAGRLTYALHEHCCFRSVTLRALDGSVLWGQNLNRQGFKWAIGGGYFNERWSYSSYRSSDSNSGLQLTSGIGYNWRFVSLDAWLNVRRGTSYRETSPGADHALNTGLAVGYRF